METGTPSLKSSNRGAHQKAFAHLIASKCNASVELQPARLVRLRSQRTEAGLVRIEIGGGKVYRVYNVKSVSLDREPDVLTNRKLAPDTHVNRIHIWRVKPVDAGAGRF